MARIYNDQLHKCRSVTSSVRGIGFSFWTGSADFDTVWRTFMFISLQPWGHAVLSLEVGGLRENGDMSPTEIDSKRCTRCVLHMVNRFVRLSAFCRRSSLCRAPPCARMVRLIGEAT